jgi:saccharopine dehydrogenase-like NADP-dependent oxidoreductase
VKSPSYLIAGCGHFGRQAALKLLRKDPQSRITVVDQNEKSLAKLSRFPIQTVVCDGQSLLRQLLLNGEPVDYIIPAVPYHLAFETILSCLIPLGAKRTEMPSLQGLPNPTQG